MYSSAFSYVVRTLPGVHEEKFVHENEDAYIVMPERPKPIPAKGLLMAVLDGISSGGNGMTASRAARTAIQVCWSKVNDAELIEPIEMIYQLMVAAQVAVLASIEGKQGGTTCLLALVRHGVLTFGHVGDCQLMLSRGALGFQPLTQDQTALVRTRRGYDLQRQMEQSQQSDNNLADDEMHDYALLENTLTRYLGMSHVAPDPRDWVEVGQCRLEQGDVFLLCSDGLLKAITVSDLRYSIADVTEEQADDLLRQVERTYPRNRDDTTFFLIGVHVTLPAVGAIKQYIPTFNRLLGEEDVSAPIRRDLYATITEEIPSSQPQVVPLSSSDPRGSEQQVLDTLLHTPVPPGHTKIPSWLIKALLLLLIAIIFMSIILFFQH